MNQEVLDAIRNLSQVLEQYNTSEAGTNERRPPSAASPTSDAAHAPAPAVTAGVAEDPVGTTEIKLPRGASIKISTL